MGLSAATLFLALGGTVLLSSCIPTYPKEKLPEAVKEVCRIEYDMDVEVAVEGSTIGIYYPMEGLLDPSLGISKEAWDKISNLILIASRVVLSTDADIKFYVVVTQDVRLPELQVVIIKHVDDVKHGMYRNISRNESFKRTIFSINPTPQAKKERSIEKVFDKLGLEGDTRESIMNEFFRSAPTKLSDIGYWRGSFYIKAINKPEFLASQMANRIKINFRQEKDLEEVYQFRSAEGSYVEEKDKKYFLVKFKIFDEATGDEEPGLREKKIQEIMRVASEVMDGYKFRDFDYLEIEDQLENVKLWADMADVYDFNRRHLSVRDVVRTSGKYF
jgi:hypothetical protein